jgi:hypothetical protein
MVPRHAVLAVSVCLGLALVAPAATAQQPLAAGTVRDSTRPSPVDLPPGSLITDGPVWQLVRDGERVYAVGGFHTVGRYAGPGAVLDGVAAQTFPSPEIADGQVSVVVSDGDGGWYLGGDFSRIGGDPAGGLAHVLADGTLDAGFLPVTDGLVSAIALRGDTLYVGGDFREVDGTPRDRLAAVATTDGSLLPFAGASTRRVTEIVASPTAVYVGSDRVTALDPQTGTPLPAFSSSVHGDVHALELGDDRLYVGTDELVALDPATGAVDPAFDAGAPEDHRSYHALLVTDTVLYAGSDRADGLVALDRATGAALPSFAPTFGGENGSFGGPGGVYDLALDGDRLWAAGSFTSAGGDDAHGLAVLDMATGAREDDDLPSYDQQVNAVELSGDHLYVGGTFSMTDWTRTNGVAAVDAETLDPVPAFHVGPSSYGDLQVTPSALYVAPNHVEGYDARPDSPSLYPDHTSRISAFDPATGAALPEVTRRVRNLSGVSVIGDLLYVARRLQSDVRFPRNRIEVYDGTGQRVRSFGVPLRGYVTTLDTLAGDLLVAGSFKRRTPAGGPRNTAMLRLDPRTGERRPFFDPKIHGPVYDVAVHGDAIYASGLFGQVNWGLDGDRPGVVKLNAQSRSDQDFAPAGFAGNRLYVRLTPLDDLLFVDGPNPRFLDPVTGARVDGPGGGPAYEVDAITSAPGGHLRSGRLTVNLGGQQFLGLGFVAPTS